MKSCRGLQARALTESPYFSFDLGFCIGAMGIPALETLILLAAPVRDDVNILLTEAISGLPSSLETPPVFNTSISYPSHTTPPLCQLGTMVPAPRAYLQVNSGARAPCSPHHPVMEA